MENETKLQFENVGDSDQIQYHKADIVKACVIGADLALSFYQLDYQALANSLTGKSSLKPSETKLIPISKIVMNRGALGTLEKELQNLMNQISNQKVK